MHTQRDSMYVVWMSRGNGIAPGAKFRRIEDALRYVDERRNTASFAIRMPDVEAPHHLRKTRGQWPRKQRGAELNREHRRPRRP